MKFAVIHTLGLDFNDYIIQIVSLENRKIKKIYLTRQMQQYNLPDISPFKVGQEISDFNIKTLDKYEIIKILFFEDL